ncbi:MAG TPA: tripartite tricarboxylate transporter TctB family protein [Noviherbaspirillum sp.]|nr:tripartite tricarboxylate transporter TctB family protein [Noviherbaspirillum sp.]
MKIRNYKDFWAGLLCAAFGLFFAVVGSQYRFGTAAKMGPGYFPTVLGCVVVVLGLLVTLTSMSPKAAQERVPAFAWKPLVLVLGAVALFGLLLNQLGLVLCIVMLVCVSSMASHEFTWKGTILNATALLVLCMTVFVWALQLQFPLWPNLTLG